MNNRLKILRKHFEKTQELFGQSLGVSRGTYASYEMGRVVPTDTFVQLLCAVYRVNEAWLKDGVGEMLAITNESIILDLARNYNLDELDTKIVECFIKLSQEDRQSIKRYLMSLTEVTKELSEEEQMEAEIQAELKEIEAQLRLEKRAREKSSASQEQKQA